jgi:hypothetical protein
LESASAYPDDLGRGNTPAAVAGGGRLSLELDPQVFSG